MKTIFTIALAAVLFLAVLQPLHAQTISLTIDPSGKPSIAMGAGTLADKQISVLPVTVTSGIRIAYLNLSGKAPLIALKGSDNSAFGVLDVPGLPAFFTNSNILSTGNDFKIKLNTHTYNLNRPFVIYLGVNDNAPGVISASFVPTLAAAAPVGPAAGQPAANTAANTSPAPPAYQPGSAVYDALKLSLAKQVTLDDIKTILSVYFPNTNLKTLAEVIAAIDSNPILKNVMDAQYLGNRKAPLNGAAEAGEQPSSGLSLSSVGGLDITSIADGLAQFLVKRAKEELSTAFFSKLQQAIQNEPDLTTLLPKTSAVLGAIGKDGYNYNSYLQNLREAFKNDVANVDATLPGIIKNHEAYFKTKPGIVAAIYGGCFLDSALKRQVHPGDIIATYPVGTLKDLEPAWAASFQTVQLLSESLRDTASSDAYWVNIKYLRQLVGSTPGFHIYLGLLYQQALNNYGGIPFQSGGNSKLLTLLVKADADATTFTAYKTYIFQFAEKTGAINHMIKDYTKPGNDSLAAEQYKKYFDAAMDLVNYSLEVTKLPGVNTVLPGAAKLDADFQKYLALIQSVSDLAIDISRKNYSSAINQAVAILGQLDLQGTLKTELADAKHKLKTAQENDKSHATYATKKAITDAQKSVDQCQASLTFYADVSKYGSFLAALATAKTGAQAEAVLEAFVLPAGSSSVKRESAGNIALNAYIGLFSGYEQIQGIKTSPSFNSYGLTAPIGVSFSLGQRQLFTPWNSGGHSSFSAFISLIDIGAVAAYRVKNDTTAQVPTITLKNIFSPGLFLSIGLPKTPLSINLGAQTGPSLREINHNSSVPTNDISNRLYWRYSISLVVDIPMLNLSTRSK